MKRKEEEGEEGALLQLQQEQCCAFLLESSVVVGSFSAGKAGWKQMGASEETLSRKLPTRQRLEALTFSRGCPRLPTSKVRYKVQVGIGDRTVCVCNCMQMHWVHANMSLT